MKEITEETTERKCVKCGEVKLRIQDGNYNDKNKGKRWRDEEGKLWTGCKCPKCVVEDARERARSKKGPIVNA